MAETSIEWTDATWNPVAGCTVISPGCTNCYAMRMAARLEAMNVAKYKSLTRRSGSRIVWNGTVSLDRSALQAPLRWSKSRMVFVNSMSDLFHENVLFRGCRTRARTPAGRGPFAGSLAVEDVGRAVNPAIVHGQAIGAAVQGLGGVFLDHLIYDADAQLLNASLADYLLPLATDFPNVRGVTLELRPSQSNPLGAKGAGEGGIVAVAATVANAVAAAIRPIRRFRVWVRVGRIAWPQGIGWKTPGPTLTIVIT